MASLRLGFIDRKGVNFDLLPFFQVHPPRGAFRTPKDKVNGLELGATLATSSQQRDSMNVQTGSLKRRPRSGGLPAKRKGARIHTAENTNSYCNGGHVPTSLPLQLRLNRCNNLSGDT